MGNIIVRGTTPSLVVDFSGITEFTVADIEKAVLTVKQRTKTDTYTLDDMEVGDTSLTYHWRQQETLDMRKGDTLYIDMHVLVNGERYKILRIPDSLTVEDTQYNEVL